MDFLREIVGGPKNRFKQHGYNLDLTYITDRVVAMAFPASGIEKLYRNSVDTIRQLLENAHQNKYITINISGRPIEEGKLRNVSSYDWEDHKAPPFDVLFTICDQVALFLSWDIQRIAVFHCNHGKGRTGTIICCFFLFLGIFRQTPQVMKFYGERRFATEGYGVTQPCQIQYIKYFQQLLQHPDLYPKIVCINSIEFKGEFQFQQPYIKILRKSGKQVVYNSKKNGDKFEANEDGLILKLHKDYALAGDIVIEIKDNKSVGHNLLISYAFNTAFVNPNNALKVKLKELSPLGKQKLSNFGKTFQMFLNLKQLCHCDEKKNVAGCSLCKGILKDEYQSWQKINSILKRRQNFVSKGRIIGFGEYN